MLYFLGLDGLAAQREEPRPEPTMVASEHLTPRKDVPQVEEVSEPGWRDLLTIFEDEPAQQVRIQQTLRIRVTPRRGRVNPQSILAQLPRSSPQSRLVERKAGSCLSASDIAGVQVGQTNRLVLYMRDRRIFTAYLDKACRAREFYSGFYLERQSDGKLCAGRDKLHSRAGGSCELGRFGQLVAVRD